MGEPVIVVAQHEWRVPLFAPRQNRIVVPALMQLGTRVEGRYDLLLDIVFAALTRTHPQITRTEFDDWPVATHELLAALPVIAQQTGLTREARKPALAQARAHPPDWGTAGTGYRVPRDTISCPPPDWDAIIAEVVNFLPGTTPDYWEDALTVPRLEALREQWRVHPPPHLLFAAWLRYRPRPRDEDALSELLRLFPSGALKLN